MCMLSFTLMGDFRFCGVQRPVETFYRIRLLAFDILLFTTIPRERTFLELAKKGLKYLGFLSAKGRLRNMLQSQNLLDDICLHLFQAERVFFALRHLKNLMLELLKSKWWCWHPQFLSSKPNTNARQIRTRLPPASLKL